VKKDLHGKFYMYLRRVLQQFLNRLARVEMDLELLNVDAIQLPESLQENNYARIEVRNLKHVGRSLITSRYQILLMPGIWYTRNLAPIVPFATTSAWKFPCHHNFGVPECDHGIGQTRQ
jgi:hypothetical protein